jgi:hypothetical protein
MRRVLSVSLGSSKRDKIVEVELLGERIAVERRGTNGDTALFKKTMEEADGQVDALCVGGADLNLRWSGRIYALVAVHKLTAGVKRTPLVDGSGVKESLEPRVVRWMQEEGLVDWREAHVLVTSGVDRFGMSDELRRIGAKNVIFGDLMLDLGVPLALTFRGVDIAARLCLPLMRRLPMSWLYPTGHAQDEIKPKYEKWYQWADVIAGDFLLIRKHMPAALRGKLLLTNTTTAEDMELLKQRGVKAVISTSVRVEGRSFGTNVLEGILTILSGKARAEMGPEDFVVVAERIGWKPDVIELGG